MFLLIGLLVAAAIGLYLERERLQKELQRVSGEVSNMHARLDSGDSDVQDTLTFVQAQMSTLFQEQEQLSIALTDTRNELYDVLTENESTVASDTIDPLLERLEEQRERAALRDSQLAAIHTSLDALEEAGTSGRRSLTEEIAHVEAQSREELEALETSVAALANDIDERLSARDAERQEKWSRFEASLSELESAKSDNETLESRLSQRLDELENDLRQVRQAQLAFSAQLEMLR
jgi:chromosome segregation ATPase